MKKNLKNHFLVVLGIAVMLYFAAVMFAIGYFEVFSFLMVLFGLLLVLVSAKKEHVRQLIKKIPKTIKVLGLIVIFLAVISFAVVEGLIIYNFIFLPKPNADYVIVLGCKVNGTAPSKNLTQRVNAAVRYLAQNENTKVIVSGGQCYGEDIPESLAMRELLEKSGIASNRIFEENKSESTTQNLSFSNELYNLTGKNIVIATSDFHIFRSLAIARKLNYTSISGLPCKTNLFELPARLSREYFAVLYYKIKGKI